MSDVAAGLAAGAGQGRPADKVIETSIAKVFLFAARVLKLKKPVDFGFLDFTTVEQRRWASEREVTFNRETAPDLYRGAHAITREADGGLALDGAGEAVDWVVEMRRFDDSTLLSRDPASIDGAMAEMLGRQIARFHVAAQTCEVGAGRDCLAYVLDSNASLLRRKAEVLGREAVERLIADTRAEFDRVAGLLLARGAAGFVRRCHGDLHLGNIAVERGKPLLFDCIEFNDTFSRIDVLYDFGFLLMDLGFRDARPAANRALNAWLDEAARTFAIVPLYRGLRVLPLVQAVRAAVRCHVTVNQDETALARRYLAVAQQHLAPAPPRLMAVGGYSGAGKTTFARAHAARMGAAPGAVVLRSDEIRKRLWGRQPLERLPPEAYAPGQSERVYAALFEAARHALAAGCAVVLDAAFLRPHERAAAQALGAECEVPFEGVWMTAPPETLRARIAARTDDASDADLRVLEGQLAMDVGEIAWRRGQL